MASETSADDYAAAANSIRETAKWLMTAFAAPVAILVGTSPLTDVALLPRADLIFALVGMVGAIVGAGFAIKLASDILVPNTSFLADIRDDPALHLMIDKNAADLLPVRTPSLNDFLAERERVHQELSKDRIERDEAEREANKSELDDLLERNVALNAVTERILGVASYERLQRKFKMVRKWLFVLAAIVMFSVGDFVAETHASAATEKKSDIEVTCAQQPLVNSAIRQGKLVPRSNTRSD